MGHGVTLPSAVFRARTRPPRRILGGPLQGAVVITFPVSVPAAEDVSGSVCDLCGTDRHVAVRLEARDYEYGVPGVFRLARCPACDLYFQAPRPALGSIPTFYPLTYPVYGDDPVTGWLFRVMFWLEARRIARLIGPRGRVLDVGCGAGAALAAMAHRENWELYGVELDPGAAQRARALGFNVQQGDLIQADFEPGTFALVRMGHVLEHFREPLRALKRAYDLLRPGGILFGETPNTACWDFRLFGRYWGALHVPRHITLFCEKALRLACRQVGFEEVRVIPRLRTVGWSAGLQNFLSDRWGLRVPPNGRVKWYPLLIVPFLPVTALQALVSRPATIAFVARKP